MQQGVEANHHRASLLITRRYIGALGAIACLLILIQVVLQIQLSRPLDDMHLMSLADRQRAFSQQVSKAALAIMVHAGDPARDAYRQQLSSTLTEWQLLYSGVQQGSAEVMRLFAALNPHYQAIRAAGECILVITGQAAGQLADLPCGSDIQPHINRIIAEEPVFLGGIDDIDAQYQREAEGRIGQLQRLELVLLVTVLAVIALEGLLVFRPAVRQIQQTMTGLLRSQQSLQQSEERFRVTFEQADIGMAHVGLDGRWLRVNRRFCEIVGYSQEELLAGTFRTLTYPPDLDASLEIQKQLLSGDIQRASLEKRYVHKNGSLIWTHVTVAPVGGPSGDLEYFISVIEDITERKRAEEEIRSVAKFPSENPNPVLRLRHDGVLLYANEASRWLLEEWNCAVGDDAPLFWRDLVAEALSSRSGRSVDIEYRDQTWSFFVAPILDEGYVNLYGLNLTARKQVEAKLQSAKEAAEAASRAKGIFLASMSHELRTPLNSIIGMSQVLLMRAIGPLNDMQIEYTNDILVCGKHLLSLINDVLDLSRAESKGIQLIKADVSLPGVLFEALGMLRQRAADQSITMKTDIDETLAPVCCDRRRIVEVVFNLLDNALKYTPREGQIAIQLYQDGDNARVDITDSGIGIAPEDLVRLFQPFERLEQVSLSRQYEGTGLGLALSKQLVELHGGAIGVQSAGEGRGSTFWFTLPFQG